CQEEGEAARERGDEELARQRFEVAGASVRESLHTWEELKHQPHAARSHSQLARIYLLLGELDKAEDHAHRAREVREGLGLIEVERDYAVLAEIAQARGNDGQAEEWQAKRDALRAELKRRAQGAGGLPPQLLQALRSLATACAQAGVDRAALDPQAEAG